MNEVNIAPCAKSVATQLAELSRHELRRNMNEVNIAPYAKSVATRLAVLSRHELRRLFSTLNRGEIQVKYINGNS